MNKYYDHLPKTFEEWRADVRWIPVTERLPDRSINPIFTLYEPSPGILVLGTNAFLKEAYGHTYNSWAWELHPIRFWMEPPPPPTLGKGDAP